MIRAALANPIAVLMACIAVVVFSAVVVPRLSVDTFPELSPPVLVIGTQAPGMGPRDVEKTLTWRFEKYVSATPGVDHVQSVSRAGLSVIFVWLKWGVDLSSAQVLVQQQVSFAMSSVPKSLGVVPPFVLQYDPSNAPVIQIAVSGGGLTGPQLYDYAANVIEPVIEGIGGVASASPNGGRERQINVVVDPAKALRPGGELGGGERRGGQGQRALAVGPPHRARARRQRLHQRWCPPRWRTSATPSSASMPRGNRCASRTWPGWKTAGRPTPSRSPSTARTRCT